MSNDLDHLRRAFAEIQVIQALCAEIEQLRATNAALATECLHHRAAVHGSLIGEEDEAGNGELRSGGAS